MVINHARCSKCKGKQCCQKAGCALSPKDFGGSITKEVLRKRLHEDIVFTIIPVTFKTPQLLQFRGEMCYALFIPRIKGKNDKNTFLIIKKQHEYNPCMYWSLEKGCEFSDSERPYGGLSLVPQKNPKKCYNTYEASKKHIMDWKPYQEIIYSLLIELHVI